jgi:hypothetical protein
MHPNVGSKASISRTEGIIIRIMGAIIITADAAATSATSATITTIITIITAKTKTIDSRRFLKDHRGKVQRVLCG